MFRGLLSCLCSLLPGCARRKPRSTPSTLNPVEVVADPQHRLSSKKSVKDKDSACYIDPQLVEPYDYTIGRWLKNDTQQRESRHINFSFSELCNKATELCPAARSVKLCKKQEGGFNRAFLFIMDNGDQIVAKLPCSHSGTRRLTTNSEVATMAYIRLKTNIPLPKVIAWSDDDTNPVGSEYVFMEHATGVQLADCWDSMTFSERFDFMKDASQILRQMARLEFPAYGSVYFADAPIDSTQKQPIGDGFCIGPHCGPTYWNCGPGDSLLYRTDNADHGPWIDMDQYCSGLLASASSRIPDNAAEALVYVPYHGSVQDHRVLLTDTAAVLRSLVNTPTIQSVARPLLLHQDFNKRNIFVSEKDKSKITSVIDWQAVSIEPTFVYCAETPDFATPRSNIITEETVAGNEVNEELVETREQTESRFCNTAFEVGMRGFKIPFGAAQLLDDALLSAFHHCNISWDIGIAGPRHNLIDLSQRWVELGLPGTCPYQPSEEEISTNRVQYAKCEEALKLRLDMALQLGCESDGWVYACDWDKVKPLHDELYWLWMDKATQEMEMSEKAAQYLWPFEPLEKSKKD